MIIDSTAMSLYVQYISNNLSNNIEYQYEYIFFQVWDNLFAEWKVDNTLRVECVEDPEIECCEYVQIRSTGALKYYHRNAMGNYTSQRQKNNRIVYKHEEQQLYLHYNDFGVLEVKNN